MLTDSENRCVLPLVRNPGGIHVHYPPGGPTIEPDQSLSMTRFIPLQWLLLEQWRRNHLAATFSAALIGAGFMLVMPFLPLYISQLGVESEAAVAIWSGVILGSSPLIASFVGPIWGKLADRFGLRIMAIRVSLVLFVIWFLMGLARNVQELLILRILSGFFGGFGSLSVALVAHSSPTDRISRAIGGLQATQTFSMALGPFAGGVLAAWIGIRNTFFVTAALCFLTLLLFLLLYRDHPHNGSPQTDGDNPKTREGLSSLLRLPNLKVLAILLLAVTVIERSFAPAIPLFVTSLSANRVQAAGLAGLILSLSAFGESLAAWFSGRRMSRASPRRLLLLRLGLGLLFCLALTLATSCPTPGSQGLAGVSGRGGLDYCLQPRQPGHSQPAAGFRFRAAVQFHHDGQRLRPHPGRTGGFHPPGLGFFGRRHPLWAAGADGLPVHRERQKGSEEWRVKSEEWRVVSWSPVQARDSYEEKRPIVSVKWNRE